MTLEHLDTIIAFVAVISGVSLLVTTLTQAVSAALGLRGTNLHWGVETLLRHVDPALSAHAAEITDKVLHHPLISDSSMSGIKTRLTARWRLANSIRKDELLAILHELAAAPTPAGAQPLAWKASLQDALDTLDRADADRLLQLVPAIRKALPDQPNDAEEIVSRLAATAGVATGKIDQWFDSVMDRVAQRFVLHTRLWTVVFSVVLAFALHLDAVRIYSQLSSDSDLRTRIVASADALTKKAEELNATTGAQPAAVYIDAMKRLLAAHPVELQALPPPVGFTDLAGGRAWLEQALQAAKVAPADPWLERYEAEVSREALRTAAQNFHSLVNDRLTLQLIPVPYPPVSSYWAPNWVHFWGTLASAVLLSLGAPFWFNLLKDLSSLRPVIAKKQAREAAAKAGSG